MGSNALRSRASFAILVGSLSIIFTGCPLDAQEQVPSQFISGYVTDSNHRPVRDADVQLAFPPNYAWWAKTDDQGGYRVGPIEPGKSYTLTIMKKEFQSTRLDLGMSPRLRVDVVMKTYVPPPPPPRPWGLLITVLVVAGFVVIVSLWRYHVPPSDRVQIIGTVRKIDRRSERRGGTLPTDIFAFRVEGDIDGNPKTLATIEVSSKHGFSGVPPAEGEQIAIYQKSASPSGTIETSAIRNLSTRTIFGDRRKVDSGRVRVPPNKDGDDNSKVSIS